MFQLANIPFQSLPTPRKSFILFAFLTFSLILISLLFSVSVRANANITYHGGYYTNLSGAGADINGNISNYNDEADCSTSQGYCKARNRNTNQDYSGGRVDEYVCNGKFTNCDFSHNGGSLMPSHTWPDSAYIHYIYDTNMPSSYTDCNHTIQLDVYDGGSTLHGYMTWYSGDCSTTTTTSNPEKIITCDNRTIDQATLENELRGAGYNGPWNDINAELIAFDHAACPNINTTVIVTTCNNIVTSQQIIESQLKGANYPGPWGDINTELQAYNRAACPAPAPQTFKTCDGRSITQATLESELRGANYPGPWGDVQTELDAFNRAACPTKTTTSQQTATTNQNTTTSTTPSQAQQQTQAQTILINEAEIQTSPNPSASTTVKVTTTSTASSAKNSASISSSTPEVLGTSTEQPITTLPQTGAPLAALALGSLVPVGNKLKKFGRKGTDENLNANAIWEKRKLQS